MNILIKNVFQKLFTSKKFSNLKFKITSRFLSSRKDDRRKIFHEKWFLLRTFDHFWKVWITSNRSLNRKPLKLSSKICEAFIATVLKSFHILSAHFLVYLHKMLVFSHVTLL